MIRYPMFAAVAVSSVLGFAGPALADHLNIPVEGISVDGSTVTFPSVLIDKDGFVVVHAMENGAPVLPGNVGHTAVKAGTTENVAVMVDGLEAGADYMVMLHYDTDGNGEYGFGEGSTDVDTPALKPDNTPYTKEVKAGM